MLQFQIRRGKLVWLGYRVGNTTYDLCYLKKAKSVWNMFASLISTNDIKAATELYKLAFSVAACPNWVRFKSGHWGVQYAGHILHVCSAGTVEVSLQHANPTSQVPKDIAIKAAEIAYYIRREWYNQRAAKQAEERNTRRTYRAYRSYRSYRKR